MAGWLAGWLAGWMGGWMDGWMDGWSVCIQLPKVKWQEEASDGVGGDAEPDSSEPSFDLAMSSNAVGLRAELEPLCLQAEA